MKNHKTWCASHDTLRRSGKGIYQAPSCKDWHGRGSFCNPYKGLDILSRGWYDGCGGRCVADSPCYPTIKSPAASPRLRFSPPYIPKGCTEVSL